MSFIEILFTTISGFFAGLGMFLVGDYHYNQKNRRFHMVPPMYSNPVTRILYFILVGIFLIFAFYFSAYWWVNSIIIIWTILGWQSGRYTAYKEDIESVAKLIIDDKGISVSDAKKEAREIVDACNRNPYPQ